MIFSVGCEGDGNALSGTEQSATVGSLSGSYARLIAVGNYLYAVDQTDLITFDASDRDDPREMHRQTIGRAVETLFHHSGNLFIGSREGMFTYTIQNDGVPQRRGEFAYSEVLPMAEPCDPVVANDNVAYATLYSDRSVSDPCGRTQRIQMLVAMDITDLDDVQLIRTYEVPSPRGLALRGDLLFVCNDASGLTVFDVANPSDIQMLSRLTDMEAWDVIAKDDVLMVVSTTELIQYDYSDPSALVELSRIPMPRT